MRMQNFAVKKPTCNILKTKNFVPFEVQYTSTTGHVLQNVQNSKKAKEYNLHTH